MEIDLCASRKRLLTLTRNKDHTMKLSIFLFLLAAVSAIASDKAESLKFPEPLKKGVTKNASGNTEIAGTSVSFPDIPVKPRERLKITINARVKEGDCIESQGGMESLLPSAIWSQQGFPWKLATLDFEYKTSDGKRLWTQYYGAPVPIYSNQFQDYSTGFYVIDGASELRISIRAKDPKNIVEVKSACLERVDSAKEKYINVNPSLEYGKYNPAGYGYAHKSTLSTDGNGKPYLEMGTSWFVGDCIPVNPGDRLRVSYGGEAVPEKNQMTFTLNYFKTSSWNENERVGKNRLPMRLTPQLKEDTQEFTVPEGAYWMRISATGGTMRYIKIEKLNPAEK